LQVNSFVGAFYDAVLLYAQAASETIRDGFDPTNGSEVTSRMWNRTFRGLVSVYFQSRDQYAPPIMCITYRRRHVTSVYTEHLADIIPTNHDRMLQLIWAL